MTRDAATEAQVRAARPDVSSWVSANAGSGKTRVLTDRVARLLLGGADPRRILCLTYTKAAAGEMQNRLFKRLGGWAMLPDDDLRAELQTLGDGAMGIADDDLAHARRLFAAALETPGGLKIQTIHSFCEALLRQFPLEAGISPQFAVMEDRQATQMRGVLAEHLAEDPGAGFAGLAPHILSSEHRFDTLLVNIVGMRERFELDPEGPAFATELGAPNGPPPSFDGIATAAELAAIIAAVIEVGVKTDRERRPLYEALLRGAAAPGQHLLLLKKDGEPTDFTLGAKVKAQCPEAEAIVRALQDRAVAIEEDLRSRKTFAAAQALARFGRAFIAAYDVAKRDQGLLDFDDLIRLAGDLLTESGAREWVRYRLDGGIEHVLVDEAQDTSPAQWRVVDAICREFFTGEGAQANQTRTIFVVGDEKQSIYSFQGAQPAAFGAQQQRYGEMLNDVAQALERCDLLYSFRSARPVLDVVDAISARKEPMAAGGAEHRAFHGDMAGRVELWPFVEGEASGDRPDPWVPGVARTAPDPKVQLGLEVAQRVAGMLRDGVTLPGGGRRLRPGDVLILVRRRQALFSSLS